jgi:uncharacterized protein YjbI with pentapeptide repeats
MSNIGNFFLDNSNNIITDISSNFTDLSDIINYLEINDPEIFQQINFNNIDLSGIDLSGINLQYASFNNTITGPLLPFAPLLLPTNYVFLTNDSNLSYIIGPNVNLENTDLSGLNLTNLNLTSANLSSTNLTSVNLIGANLSGANLSGANLSGADLSSANLNNTDLRGVIFNNTKTYPIYGTPILSPEYNLISNAIV